MIINSTYLPFSLRRHSHATALAHHPLMNCAHNSPERRMLFSPNQFGGLGHDSVGKKELKKQPSDAVDSLCLRQGGRVRCNQTVSHRCLEFKGLAWLGW